MSSEQVKKNKVSKKRILLAYVSLFVFCARDFLQFSAHLPRFIFRQIVSFLASWNKVFLFALKTFQGAMKRALVSVSPTCKNLIHLYVRRTTVFASHVKYTFLLIAQFSQKLSERILKYVFLNRRGRGAKPHQTMFLQKMDTRSGRAAYPSFMHSMSCNPTSNPVNPQQNDGRNRFRLVERLFVFVRTSRLLFRAPRAARMVLRTRIVPLKPKSPHTFCELCGLSGAKGIYRFLQIKNGEKFAPFVPTYSIVQRR